MNNSSTFTIPTAADIEEMMFDKNLAQLVEEQKVLDAAAVKPSTGVSFEYSTIASLTAAGCEFTNA